MRALIKNALASGFFTAAGLIIADQKMKLALAAGAVVSVTLVAVTEGAKQLYKLSVRAKQGIANKFNANKEPLKNFANAFNPANSDQNSLLFGALGSAAGALSAEMSNHNPLMGAATGLGAGLVTGYFVSDQRIGEGLQSLGGKLRRAGSAVAATPEAEKKKSFSISISGVLK